MCVCKETLFRKNTSVHIAGYVYARECLGDAEVQEQIKQCFKEYRNFNHSYNNIKASNARVREHCKYVNGILTKFGVSTYPRIFLFPNVSQKILVSPERCGTLNSNQAKKCECVMKFPLIYLSFI